MVKEPVKTPGKRTRRAEKASATHSRIVDAAAELFLDRGYVSTTIEAIAERADVAVETVYARFRNKRNLLIAVKDAAVTEGGAIPLEQRPELGPLAAEPDQRRQIRICAGISRGMLERVSPAYALLRDGAAADEQLRQQLTAEIDRRREFQRKLVEVMCASGPLRKGLTVNDAADTYSALANPETYLLLTEHHGWTPDRFQAWLADSIERLLLAPASPTSPRGS
jgi:AcrR family transcriptional regulator